MTEITQVMSKTSRANICVVSKYTDGDTCQAFLVNITTDKFQKQQEWEETADLKTARVRMF